MCPISFLVLSKTVVLNLGCIKEFNWGLDFFNGDAKS